MKICWYIGSKRGEFHLLYKAQSKCTSLLYSLQFFQLLTWKATLASLSCPSLPEPQRTKAMEPHKVKGTAFFLRFVLPSVASISPVLAKTIF